MERLTTINEELGLEMICRNEKCWTDEEHCPRINTELCECLQEILRQLKRYQDTGLTQEEIMDGKLLTGWIPVEERLPEEGRYILLSFSNFTLPMIGRYESDAQGGAFYLGDCDEEDTCIANDLYVNAWMHLPEAYKTNEQEGER